MTYFIIFLFVLLLNWYIICFGKNDLTKLKGKVPVGMYLKDLKSSVVETLGDKWTVAIELFSLFLSLVVISRNAMFFLLSICAVVVGTYVAKLSYRIGAVNNMLNWVTTSINRLR
jgi:hypothetical protein